MQRGIVNTCLDEGIDMSMLAIALRLLEVNR
jgi:hypothetical protein